MRKSSFLTPLILEENGDHFVVKEPFTYHVGSLDNDIFIHVPAGFKTDFASIPSIFTPIVKKLSKANKGSVIHDFLYMKVSEGKFSRVVADAIFLESMKVLNVPWWQRIVMYLAVRIFGGIVICLKKREQNRIV